MAEVLPPPAAVEVVIGDAREQVERAEPGRYDVIVADVFDRASMPASVATTGFAAAALLADPAVPRGRRAGNAVLVAGDAPGAWAHRAAVAHGPGLTQFATGAKACLDEPG